MNVYCQLEIKVLRSNFESGLLPLLLWTKMLLLGVGIGVAYKLSHIEVGKKES